MTKLEEEMLEAFEDLNGDRRDMAMAAAEVAKKYIEKAFDMDLAFWSMQNGYWSTSLNREEIIQRYLKENGIIE